MLYPIIKQWLPLAALLAASACVDEGPTNPFCAPDPEVGFAGVECREEFGRDGP
jgi:hypothetical protein